jgi:hypothetical protein
MTLNPRPFLSPVWEYPVGDQWIMMDSDDGYVLWTAIWKGAKVFPSPDRGKS